MSPRVVLVNSTVAAVLASLIMVLAHELTHLITGLAMGFPGTIYAFGVTHDGSPSETAIAIMAGSAPLFSFVTGLIAALWSPISPQRTFAHLLWRWFAFISMMEGICYLIITPFGAGDTAEAAKHLGWPSWVSIAMCLIGVALMFAAARMFSPTIPLIAGTDRKVQWALAFWPWLIGSAILSVLAFIQVMIADMQLSDGEQTAIATASAATLSFAPMGFMFRRN